MWLRLSIDAGVFNYAGETPGLSVQLFRLRQTTNIVISPRMSFCAMGAQVNATATT